MKNIITLFLLGFLLFPVRVFAGGGQDAGREWAEENAIDDPDDCHSAHPGRWDDDNINNSPSFTEGCLEHLRDESIIDDDDELIDEDSDEDSDEDEDDEDEEEDDDDEDE